MKILLDARLYGLENTGIGRYLIHLVDELQKIDRKNKYFILLRKKYYDSLVLKPGFNKVLADFGIYGFSEQLRLPAIIREIGPDIVHFPHFNVPIFWRGNFVVTLHDMTMHKEEISASKLHPFIFRLKKIFYKAAFRHAVKVSSAVITPSTTVKDEISGYFKLDQKKIRTIYEGFDGKVWTGRHRIDVLKVGELTPGKYFIYVGNLYPHKNITNLIKALSIFNRRHTETIDLAIVGAGSVFMRRLEEHIIENRMEDHVKVLGFVGDRDTSSLLRSSISLVNPSLSEGFGLQGLEAISSGALVLCSDIPIFKEVYGPHAVYFDPMDPLDMAKKMQKVILMTKKEKALRLASSRKFIKRYSWEKMARETLKIYNDTK